MVCRFSHKLPAAEDRAVRRSWALGVVPFLAFVCSPAVAQEGSREQLREAPARLQDPIPPNDQTADYPESLLEGDGFSLPVSRFHVRYEFGDRDGLPTIEQLGALAVPLVRRPDGVIDTARAAGEPFMLQISQFDDASAPVFSQSALAWVIFQIQEEIKSRGIIAFQIIPSPEQVDLQNSVDLREEDLSLTLAIYVGTVEKVRTLSSGRRWESLENPTDIKQNARIRRLSPVQEGDLIGKRKLDRYLQRVNRHPGRRVEVSIAQYAEPASEGESEAGLLSLDYLVNEDKPWSLYFQLENTGTEQTDEWRERFGFVHNQLTNSDDIFRLDYVTAAFDAAHAVTGSYERPVAGDGLRVRGYGSWSKYSASDVGQGRLDFEGDSWEAGGELVLNVIQGGSTFVDLLGGFRGGRVEVDQLSGGTVQESGSADLAYPYVGLSLSRDRGTSRTQATATLDWQIASNSLADIGRLGRQSTDENWTTFRGEFSHSFYLEPLLCPRAFAGEGIDPTQELRWQRGMTLAHEVDLSLRGQYVLNDDRVIPNDMLIAGGLYTVRGYPESIVSGDNGVVASAEYRFHLPRALRPVSPTLAPSGAFRWRPDRAYGSADWDLIFSGFFDAGRVTNNNRQFFESDETLVGAGVGLELVISRQLQASCRLDWGTALSPVRDYTGNTLVDVGHSELYFSFTLLY